MTNKAVFLDRDGVLNQELGDYIKRFEDFKILPHVIEGLKILKDAGYLLVVITNQGGLAKKEYGLSDLNQMHAFMVSELAKHEIEFADIYYCPHHPITGNCLCRKPGSLLVEKALSKHDIDPLKSFFIGDKERDIVCGEEVGVTGFLIDPNENWIPIAQKIAGTNSF